MLSQMNSTIKKANNNIKNGVEDSFAANAGIAVIAYAYGAEPPTAVAFVGASLVAEGWTILSQVPGVVSGFDHAGKQAEQNLRSCSGG